MASSAETTCQLTEEELWSGIDRAKPEIERHIESCPICRNRAAGLRAGIDAVAAGSAPVEPPLPERIGSYSIRRRLGHGGMGIVYEGEQQAPRRLVAVKVVRGGPFVDEYRLKLFEREAQTLGRLKHPAIAAIYEGGRTDDGQPFFAMELVQGRPVNEFVRAESLPRRERLMLFGRICEAINYAHQRGVIHRDLKPTNILVDSTGQPKILDFGLARITDGDAAATTISRDVGRIIGTLPYMSPEEARGHPDGVDVRSDVYSLGIILFELLTSQLPYSVPRGALPEALRVISEDPPARPSTIDPTLRGDLETIILKALAKEPERRYQGAAALADDIHRFLADQPILARRAGLVYRSRKLVQRHKFAFLVGVVVSAVLLGAAFWIHLGERQFQENTALFSALQDFRVAVTEADFARALHDSGDYAKAERLYRSALSTLEWLEREERAAEVRLGLGTMLIERGNPVDFDEAERLLRQAQNVYDRSPSLRREERRRLLSALKHLYGPERWDLPDEWREVEQELRVLESASDTLDTEQHPIAPSG